MSGALTDHQREALDLYWTLVAERGDDLFTERTLRPIVLDRPEMERYAAETGVVLGVMAATPYAWLVNDLVVSTRGDQSIPHPYLRLIAPPDAPAAHGVVVIATVLELGDNQESIVLVEQERHATGQLELEFPRGFGTSGLDSATQALDELLTESGYSGEDARPLGTLLPDSGLSDQLVDLFHVRVSRRSVAAPELQEAIRRVLLLHHDAVWDHIADGRIRDGFAVQALALYDRFVRSTALPGS